MNKDLREYLVDMVCKLYEAGQLKFIFVQRVIPNNIPSEIIKDLNTIEVIKFGERDYPVTEDTKTINALREKLLSSDCRGCAMLATDTKLNVRISLPNINGTYISVRELIYDDHNVYKMRFVRQENSLAKGCYTEKSIPEYFSEKLDGVFKLYNLKSDEDEYQQVMVTVNQKLEEMYQRGQLPYNSQAKEKSITAQWLFRNEFLYSIRDIHHDFQIMINKDKSNVDKYRIYALYVNADTNKETTILKDITPTVNTLNVNTMHDFISTYECSLVDEFTIMIGKKKGSSYLEVDNLYVLYFMTSIISKNQPNMIPKIQHKYFKSVDGKLMLRLPIIYTKDKGGDV